MRSCVFSEMLLVSFVEKRARRIQFNPRTTTIVGGNDTGKSTLLKSIYWTFGAEPAETHDEWENANVAALIRFKIDNDGYSILRQRDVFALFDARGARLGTFASVTSGIGPALARLFDFGMTRTGRDGQKVTPPPAYFFLPFYVDQDKSWTDNWAAFSRLQQLPGHRQFMAEYHSGLRPNEFYRLTADREQQKQELQRVSAELSAVQAARRTLDERLPFQTFNLDPAAFAADLDRLLVESERLAQDEDRYRSELMEIRARIATIDMQVAMVEQQARELGADYRFATESLGDEVECPVCGTLHQNSFAQRFAIAKDEDRCRDLLLELRSDRLGLAEQLATITSGFTDSSAERQRLGELLAAKQGEIRLQDVITSQGRAEAQRIFAESIAAYIKTARSLEVRIEELDSRIRQLQDRKRQQQILTHYRALMRQFLDELDVQKLKPNSYRTISARIRETGSDKPRALLAYYYSFLHTMARYSSSVFCPIVIDEPNQQGLDPETLPTVLRFIYAHQPDGSQLIIGVENLHGVEPVGDVIALSTKWRLLTTEEFDSVSAEVRPLLAESFQLEAER